jgi:hypothetical protein
MSTMLDLSVVQKSLQDARSGRIGEYFFYIQDTVVFNPSHFYWYPNQAQFFEAIQSDLLGFLFKDPSDPGIEVLRADLTLLISALRGQKSLDFEAITLKIVELFRAYENHAAFKLMFMGTLDGLLHGNTLIERGVRNWYRHGVGTKGNTRVAAIKSAEVRDFFEFVTKPK